MLALKVVFGKLLHMPKLCKKISTVCFEQKTTICNAKFWNLWLMDIGGKNLSSNVSYFESPLICLFTMQLLWGYDDD